MFSLCSVPAKWNTVADYFYIHFTFYFWPFPVARHRQTDRPTTKDNSIKFVNLTNSFNFIHPESKFKSFREQNRLSVLYRLIVRYGGSIDFQLWMSVLWSLMVLLVRIMKVIGVVQWNHHWNAISSTARPYYICCLSVIGSLAVFNNICMSVL